MADDTHPVRGTGRHGLTPAQRDALWTWRWLGFRDATPAFKISLSGAAVALIALMALLVSTRG